MAYSDCPECGEYRGTLSSSCPHCGFREAPVRPKTVEEMIVTLPLLDSSRREVHRHILELRGEIGAMERKLELLHEEERRTRNKMLKEAREERKRLVRGAQMEAASIISNAKTEKEQSLAQLRLEFDRNVEELKIHARREVLAVEQTSQEQFQEMSATIDILKRQGTELEQLASRHKEQACHFKEQFQLSAIRERDLCSQLSVMRTAVIVVGVCCVAVVLVLVS